MIAKFVNIFNNNNEELRVKFESEHPREYKDIVKNVVELLQNNMDDYETPDPTRIHEIDDGDYQGTLVYLIGADGYQPSTYWIVMVGYGSCSCCDTLQGICEYSYDPPTKSQVDDYMTLALHIIQGMKKISQYGDDE